MIERINLLPSMQHGRSASQAELRWFVVALAVAALLIAALGTREILRRGTLERRRNELVGERDRLLAEQQSAAASIGRLQALVGEKAALQNRFDALSALQQGRSSWSDLLVRIGRITPDGLWLVSLGGSRQGDGAPSALGLRFQGKAVGLDRVSELIGSLERDQGFQAVELISTAKGTFLEHEVVDFSLTCQVKEQ